MMHAFNFAGGIVPAAKGSAIMKGNLCVQFVIAVAFLTNAIGASAHGRPDPITEPLQRYAIGYGPIEAAAYSPDGTMIAAATAAGTIIWDAATGEEIEVLDARGVNPISIAFSSDSRKILIGGSGPGDNAALWDLDAPREPVQTFAVNLGSIY